MKETAGTLLYRLLGNQVEVLLVHPSGNFNRKAAWSIPKGLPEKSESMEEAARRETFEETGIRPRSLKPLGHADYTKSPKRVHCFFGLAPENATPKAASWEIDRAEFLPIEAARKHIHHDQAVFLKRLNEKLQVFREYQ
jgi:predicted NUDIX family NTP pyrophosphohydrolase